MRLKTFFLVGCLSLTTLIGTAAAQAPATFLLKSGERISGDLIDLNASGYVITVNGQEKRISPDDLAVIDFTGNAQGFPANETQKLIPGENLLVLRDGEMHSGKMNDVGGTQPKLIYFAYTGGPQNITSDRVARIYLSNPPAGHGDERNGLAGGDRSAGHRPRGGESRVDPDRRHGEEGAADPVLRLRPGAVEH